MPPSKPTEAKRKYFTVAEANKTLPLVKAIVGDIVRQFHAVNDLKVRLAAVTTEHRRPATDPYSEELAQSQALLDSEESKLGSYVDELHNLGVELKGPDTGLCDFYSLMDGREVYLCWRLGEPEVSHWHELDAGVAGRQPLTALVGREPVIGCTDRDQGVAAVWEGLASFLPAKTMGPSIGSKAPAKSTTGTMSGPVIRTLIASKRLLIIGVNRTNSGSEPIKLATMATMDFGFVST